MKNIWEKYNKVLAVGSYVRRRLAMIGGRSGDELVKRKRDMPKKVNKSEVWSIKWYAAQSLQGEVQAK